jgi:hypothetical protein
VPEEKVALDIGNWVNPLVALQCCENSTSRPYQDKTSPLPEGGPGFHSRLLTLRGMELGVDS